LAGQPIDSGLLPELAVVVGDVGTVPFVMPGSQELADQIGLVMSEHDVCLLDHHGAVAVGHTLEEAQIRLETLEHAAKVILAARLLGGIKPLSSGDRRRLESLLTRGSRSEVQ
jgi:L-fuculose-phosphate aldolase